MCFSKEGLGRGMQGGFCQCRDTEQRSLCRAVGGRQGQRGGRGGRAGTSPLWPDASPRRRARRQAGEVAPGGWRAGDAGVESLVEEVGLEGGRQRQRVDVTQTLLPQGQAHGAAAEIHERQGLGWGQRGERGQVSTARDGSRTDNANNSRRSGIIMYCHVNTQSAVRQLDVLSQL